MTFHTYDEARQALTSLEAVVTEEMGEKAVLEYWQDLVAQIAQDSSPEVADLIRMLGDTDPYRR